MVEKFNLFALQKNVFWVATLNNKGENYSSSGDTAPLAICRAALLAVMEEQDAV